jgi:YVTN family beta-propeller protein
MMYGRGPTRFTLEQVIDKTVASESHERSNEAMSGVSLNRRTFLALPAVALAGASCSRRRSGTGFRGYAFVANQDSHSIAAIDLEAMAVAKNIPLSGAPVNVTAALKRPFVYALAGDTGTVHEIALDRLNETRKVTIATNAVAMQMSADESAVYVLAREPRTFVRVNLVTLTPDFKIALTDDPIDFTLSPDSKMDSKIAAITFKSGLRLVDLEKRKLYAPLGAGDLGSVRFLADGHTLIVADRGERRLSAYDATSLGEPANAGGAQLITHLPLAMRPDNLCFNSDGGQLFVTGEGADAVAIVFPYRTPEVAETLLVGRNPGPMAASNAFLFVASPSAGDVSILEISTRKVVAVVSVGSDPGFITVTPDDQYALVLNRQSGDVSVLRIATITKTRDRRASLLTVIPVGSKPVSAAVRAV